MDQIPADVLEFVAMHSRPCLLRCDGTGRILARNFHPESPVPSDVRNAVALDACLPQSMRDEWVDIVREVVCSNGMVDAVVVLDGVGLELSCIPARVDGASRTVWISLMRSTADSAMDGARGRRALRHHEWGSLDVLSRCQLDTLRHVTRGLANQQIAGIMCRSKRAVEWHIRHLHRALGAGTRECLARIGRAARLDGFRDVEWQDVLMTRPARRTLEEFALRGAPTRAA